ncbi:hypothetical protein ACS0TY_030411 [Phlomoides rotata]
MTGLLLLLWFSRETTSYGLCIVHSFMFVSRNNDIIPCSNYRNITKGCKQLKHPRFYK